MKYDLKWLHGLNFVVLLGSYSLFWKNNRMIYRKCDNSNQIWVEINRDLNPKAQAIPKIYDFI